MGQQWAISAAGAAFLPINQAPCLHAILRRTHTQSFPLPPSDSLGPTGRGKGNAHEIFKFREPRLRVPFVRGVYTFLIVGVWLACRSLGKTFEYRRP